MFAPTVQRPPFYMEADVSGTRLPDTREDREARDKLRRPWLYPTKKSDA